MPNFEVVIEGPSPVPAQSHVVSCWKCAERFDAVSAAWCGCDAKLLTLKCPHCGSCFCHAPFIYKQRFWNDAPKSLRENTHRFRLPVYSSAASGADKTPVPDASLFPQPHVLVVDDEEPIRSLAACYLERMGYEVTTATGPEEALRMIDAISVDVVVTDALMPMMDGRELCRRLKEAHGSRIKVVLMTSLYTASHYRTEARHVFKVDEYLAKPLRYDELHAVLQRVAPLLQPFVHKVALAG